MTRRISQGGYEPRWSPDGSKILFSSSMVLRRPNPQLFVVGVDGGTARQLRTDFKGGYGSRTAAWTPDGQISIWAAQRNQWSFGINSEDGREAKTFTIENQLSAQVGALALEPTRFTWSRDGRSLIFEGVSRGVSSVWRVSIDTTRAVLQEPLERLTTGAGSDRDAALSPDGSKVAYSSVSERARIWSFPLDARGALGGQGVPVTPGGSGRVRRRRLQRRPETDLSHDSGWTAGILGAVASGRPRAAAHR